MIFLFDKFKKLKGTVRNRHTISLLYERERNGLYTVSAEIPLKITDKKTVYNYHKKVKDSEFLGHYDREGRFQLHKIASVDIEDSSIYIKGVHLFFDEAKAGAIIQERRFRQSELIHGARVAFESIGWSVVDFDVSDEKDYIFYNVSPLEARAILVETFGFEFDYWLDFDGKNIRNKQISVKREMGKDSNKRYNYGHNVLNIKVEQDYSEIYTAVIGRGKGEDLGDDAYGRRIEYTDVVWKTPNNPMNKPKGSRTLHDENATQLFGYHEDGKVSPRTKVEIFEDIEEPEELLQASYVWLKENSVPKAVFSLEVPDGDGLDLGDKVHVIYRDIDLVKHTRVTRVVDDLVSGNRDVEFGDTAYFKTDRRLSGVKSELKRVGGSMSSRISRLKAEFDKRFEDEVTQINEDFEQALIDAAASVDAMRVEITDEFEAAQSAMSEEFNQSVADAKQYAEDTADAKAKEVQNNLDSFSDEHSRLISEVQSDVIGVSDSIAGITDSLSDIEGTLTNTKTQLEKQVSDARADLEESISDTRTELEGKIESTEEALNQVGEDLGNAKTDLQKQLDDARAELDGLEVGGRNLLPAFTSNRWTHQARTEIEDYSLYIPSGFAGNSVLFMDVEKNTNYTMSFNSDYARYYIYEVLEDESLGKIIRTTTGSETYTFNTEDISRIRVSINTFSGNVQEEKNIWNIKLEKGTVATDWTPAPEDTEQKITNINQTITNIEGELSTKVEQTEVDTLKGTVTRQGTLLTQTANEVSSKAEKSVVDTLTGRVANTESSVTQNAAEIAKKLTKSVYDSDKKATDAKITQWSNTASETAEGLTRVIGRVSETEKGVDTAQTRIEAEAGRIDGVLSRTSNVEGKVQDAGLAIKANADGLALRATKTEVEQAIDGIEVGDRNLLLDSGTPITSSNYIVGDYYLTEDLRDGEEVTIVFMAALGEGKAHFQAYNSGGSGNASMRAFRRIGEAGDFSVYSDTFKWKAPKGNKNEFLRLYHMPSSIVSESTIKWAKLVRGNRTSLDWTPAPEDIDASISEVTDRVTTAEAELVVQAGEISQRATQSELDRVTGRVSTAETSIIQNAEEISRRLVKSDYDSDKELTDAEITKWSNLTTETAEGLAQTISRVSTAEGKVTKAQADITANAKEIALKASQSELNSVTGRVSSAESELSVQAGQIALRATKQELEDVEGRVSTAETSITQNSESLKLTATKTEVENAIDGIEVGGRNLIPNSNDFSRLIRHDSRFIVFKEGQKVEEWNTEEATYIEAETTAGNTTILTSNAHGTTGMDGVWSIYVKNVGDSNITTRTNGLTSTILNIAPGEAVRVVFQGKARTSYDFIQLYFANPGTLKAYFYGEQLEFGNKVTAYSPAPEDTDAKINDISKDYVKQSSVKVTPDRVTIGSTIVNGDTIGSVLSVSPTGIDAVAKAMRLSGDLYVDGDITTLAVNAIEGNFSRLFASSLTTNVIKSNHIQTDTALAEKLFATNANIDELVTRTHFSNSIKTISIEAAKANFASATASWFGADVIESNWLKVDTALFNRFTASSAFINSLTAKNAFISNIKAIDIDLNRATVTGGDSTNYIRMTHQNVMSYGTFSRTWAGETDTARLELGLYDGQLRMRNLDTGYRLYLTERGLSTSMAGAIDQFTSGTLEFHSQRYNEVSRGVTLHSSFGAVALVSDYSTVHLDAQLSNNINSAASSVYVRPMKDNRPGTNEFRFWVKDNPSEFYTDGVLTFGNPTSDTFGSGLRFSKSSNTNTIYATNNDGDIGTGNFRGDRFIGNLEASGVYAYALVDERLRVTDRQGYNNGSPNFKGVQAHELLANSLRVNSGNLFLGTSSGEVRVTNNLLYNGGNIGYRPIRASAFNQGSSLFYKTNIKNIENIGLSVIRDLTVVEYDLIEDVKNGIENRKQLGFIAEYSESIATIDDKAIDMYKLSSYNTKAIQELALENDSLKSEVAELRTQLNKIMEMIK